MIVRIFLQNHDGSMWFTIFIQKVF